MKKNKTISIEKEKQTAIVKFYGITPAKLFAVLDDLQKEAHDSRVTRNDEIIYEAIEKLEYLSFEIY